MTRWATALALVLAATPVRAGRVTLKEAFEQAATRNLQIDIARSGRVAARAAVAGTLGRFDLHLTSAVDMEQRSFSGESWGAQMHYKVGLAKLFSSGTVLRLDTGASQVMNRPNKATSLPNFPWQRDPFYYPDSMYGIVVINLEQPLLRGAGFTANEALVDAARELLRAAEVGLETELAAQLRDVEIEYWRWAAAVRAVEIRRASLELARVQAKRTRELIRKGRQARSDSLLAEQIVADRQDALAVAKAEKATRYERLYHLMGFPYAEIPRPPGKPEDFHAVEGGLEEVDELIRQIEGKSYLPRRLEHERAAFEFQLRAARDAAWPELTAAARFEFYGGGSNFGGALRDTFGTGTHVWMGALRFSYPLGVNAAAAEAERLQAQLRQLSAVEEDGTRRTRLAVVAARRDVALAVSRIDLATLAKRLADEKLRAEEERYAIGRTTMQNLRQFQEDLDETSLREVNAHVAYLSARAQLDYLLGRYLSRRGIAAE